MSDSIFVIDSFVTTTPGEPYRLLPFGTLVKGGKRREITAELAAKFRLPHFKPPIKLGSHDQATPGGGSIVGLEVREDGLYGVPEYTEKGSKALTDGDYRYHSPEIIWEGSGFEDPQTGEIIAGPLIIGDALLHTPHLGEAAALYTFEPQEVVMPEDTVNVPKGLWEKIMERFDGLFSAKPAQVVEENAATLVQPEQLTALEAQVEQFKAAAEQAIAEAKALKAEQTRKEQHTALVAALQQADKFGSMYIEVAKAEEAATVMGSMTEEQRAWCMRNFSALASQIQTGALFGEKGSNTPGTASDPMTALNAAITAKAAEAKVAYHEAFAMVQVEHPELFAAVYSKPLPKEDK